MAMFPTTVHFFSPCIFQNNGFPLKYLESYMFIKSLK